MTERTEMQSVKRHPYSVNFGETDLGPLSGTPGIRVESVRHEGRVYDRSRKETPVAVIVEETATITLGTYNIATALELIASFSPGDDALAAERCRRLVFTPVSGSSEKSLIFPRACLLPELEYAPGAGNHEAVLTFRALPDAEGRLLIFA